MGSYLVRRFGLMLLTLFGISVIIFVMLRLAPGNIADILFDAAGFVDPTEKAQIMKDLGLDKSLPVQYASWIGGLRKAISVFPMSPTGRLLRKSCRASRSPPGSPGWPCSSPRRSGSRSA